MEHKFNGHNDDEQIGDGDKKGDRQTEIRSSEWVPIKGDVRILIRILLFSLKYTRVKQENKGNETRITIWFDGGRASIYKYNFFIQ